MAMRILWPNIPAEYCQIARDAVGAGFETDFCASAAEVTDEQWANADAIVGQCPPQYIDKLRKCRIFVKYGVGYDDVDIERFGKLGIPVCNTPDYGTREVADHAIALMMTLAKSIAYHDSELRADLRGNWRPAHNPFGRRLSVCTFGVVGMGRIGTAAARRAKAFDMDVVFYDPYQPNGYQFAIGVRRADSLAELMGQCDFVSIHAPLTAETRNLIGAEAFAAAKRGMILINTARGPDRRHRCAVRRHEGWHRARRRARRAAAGAGQSAVAPDRRLAAQRGLDPPSPGADAALGLLHAREHARQSRLRLPHRRALSARRAPGELRQQAIPGARS